MINKKTNYIQKAFDITKENMILAQPLVIYMIVLSFTLAGLAAQTDKILHFVFLTTNLLLGTAFISGWFYMIKQGILLNKRIENGEYENPEERMKASWDLGKTFFLGVGDNFLTITTTTIFYIVIFVATMYLFFKIGTHILPNPNIDWNKLYVVANSTPAELQKYIFELNIQQIKALNLWGLYISCISSAFAFVTLFLYPALFKTKDKKEFFLFSPFIALGKNIVFILKNFIGSLGIFIFLMFLNTVFSILSIIFNLNIILSIIGLILSFYVATYAIILIFLYYEEQN